VLTTHRYHAGRWRAPDVLSFRDRARRNKRQAGDHLRGAGLTKMPAHAVLAQYCVYAGRIGHPYESG
jgi:hypothetical protein